MKDKSSCDAQISVKEDNFTLGRIVSLLTVWKSWSQFHSYE